MAEFAGLKNLHRANFGSADVVVVVIQGSEVYFGSSHQPQYEEGQFCNIVVVVKGAQKSKQKKS